MIRIAVDAVGGDHAPRAIIDGAVAAARHLDLGLVLAGPAAVIQRELARHPDAEQLSIRILDAPEVIGMAEAPTAALRRKPRASIRAAAEAVARGDAAALVSAGHTGATVISAYGAFGMLPGVAFYVAMTGFHDEIGGAALPSAFLLARLGAPWFAWAFQLAVLLTLVDTGVAMLHAINERVAAAYEGSGRPMPRALRPALAGAILVVSVYAAGAVGLVALIARGYGLLTWAFIVLLILPVLTVGVFRLMRSTGGEALLTSRNT